MYVHPYLDCNQQKRQQEKERERNNNHKLFHVIVQEAVQMTHYCSNNASQTIRKELKSLQRLHLMSNLCLTHLC